MIKGKPSILRIGFTKVLSSPSSIPATKYNFRPPVAVISGRKKLRPYRMSPLKKIERNICMVGSEMLHEVYPRKSECNIFEFFPVWGTMLSKNIFSQSHPHMTNVRKFLSTTLLIAYGILHGVFF